MSLAITINVSIVVIQKYKWYKKYRPAFCGSKIHWILFDKYVCTNTECSCNGKTFSTIESEFIKQLPTPILDTFKYLFPAKVLCIHTDFVKSLSHFTDKHVLFTAFANSINDLQRQHYYEQNNTYYTLLDKWLDEWSGINNEDYTEIDPLALEKYNGDHFEPYSAFGEPGYHNGIWMTNQYAKNIFLCLQERRENYL